MDIHCPVHDRISDTYPITKKTLKIYKEIVQQDYPIDENIGKYGLETVELI